MCRARTLCPPLPLVDADVGEARGRRRRQHRRGSSSPPSPRLPPAGEDRTADLLLALVFGLLGFGDRQRRGPSSAAASSPPRPSHASASRSTLAISKLAFKCDRRAESVGDPDLALVADRLGPGLRRLKLRSLHAVTNDWSPCSPRRQPTSVCSPPAPAPSGPRESRLSPLLPPAAPPRPR
ncbi:hypothetical protein SETIT_5G378800v2 [Setaria italica]|uniref:Uncharacterized protein n=1 Tax=Setaria italica TaxID=4555 RepID=A0A368RDF6_SETIT|nr:hypothetical protein SETIT_5G378800v2 [Setaria italica]